MLLPLQSFVTLVGNMAAALQGGAVQIVDVSVGSVSRALLEACASVALWMQWLIVQVLSMTRAATSNGADLDSWMADFYFTRLPGSPSSGPVTFSRFTVGLAATIPVGTLVKTTDGSQTFSVQADSSLPAWNGTSGYLLAATVSSVDLPVQAVSPGASGNVLSGAIGLLASPLQGVDSVENQASLGGGVDTESDADFRTRFQAYINSRSLATQTAVRAAVLALRQGLRLTILENTDLSGASTPGNFCVIVDDGGGQVDNVLLSEVSQAVDAVRPVGTTFSVTWPEAVSVSIGLQIALSAGAASSSITSDIQQAIQIWVEGLPMGGVLAVSKLEAIAHDTSAAVLSVTSAVINGAATDLALDAGAVFALSTVNVVVA